MSSPCLLSRGSRRHVDAREGCEHQPHRRGSHQVRFAPLVRTGPGRRHFGSWSTVWVVTERSLRNVLPQALTTVVESFPPGGSSMNGMNLSGNPGIVHPMQIPPTFGHPPTPLIQPRLGTLHLTTGPQQPIFTWHLGEL